MQKNKIKWTEAIKNFFIRDMRVRTKLILCILMAALLPAVVTTLFFYGSFFRSSLNNVLEGRQSALDGVTTALEAYVNQVNDVAEAISEDSRLGIIINASEESLTDNETELEDMKVIYSLFKNSLDTYMTEKKISAIRIYSDSTLGQGRFLGKSLTQEYFAPLSEIQYTYWKDLMEITGKNSTIFSGSYLSDEERTNLGMMSCVKKYRYYDHGQEKNAYIVVYFDREEIKNVLSEGTSIEGKMYYLLDARNAVVQVSDSMTDKIGRYMLDYEDIEEKIPTDKKFVSWKNDEEMDYAAYRNIRNTDWRLVWIIPRDSILGENDELLKNFLLTYLFLLFLCVGAGVFITEVIVKRLYFLRDRMRKVKEKQPEEIKEETGKDEIGELMEAYNYMTRQIQTLHRQEIEALNEKNQMETAALRAQIDPHFLYNTLDMIRWMSLNNKQEEVETAIRTLSRFYRLTTNKGNQWIQVKDELEHVELYVQLMNMRFGGKIDFLIDVPEEMLEMWIPSLIFQPIVENSIAHGILEKEVQEGSITICGWMEEDEIHFQIGDDGVGMSKEQAEAIMSGEKKQKSGIGVYNTARRIQLLYGEEKAGIKVQSSEMEGTEIEFCLPKERKESL